jgi:membrane associated rhomboid family serine protease
VSSPDLFVVCKSCGAEVSPYITECPYCGNRLRKRAPKLDKPGTPPKPPKPERPPRRAPRRRPARETRVNWGRPVATITIVALSILTTLAATLSTTVFEHTVFSEPLGFDEPWKLVTTLFVYANDGFEVAVLASIFLFGWLLERRHGAWATVLVFLAAGVAGTAAASAIDDSIGLFGAPGAAAGLLGAWAVAPLLARRRGEGDEDHDLLGAAVFAVVLVALPFVVYEAHWIEGLAGGAAGLLLGLPLARLAR